jgi:hypothetical protein
MDVTVSTRVIDESPQPEKALKDTKTVMLLASCLGNITVVSNLKSRQPEGSHIGING